MNGVNNSNQNSSSVDLYVAKLSLIGSALSTLGDGLQTIAAGIALQELENAAKQNQTHESAQAQTSELEMMQQQINYLMQKVKEIEKSST